MKALYKKSSTKNSAPLAKSQTIPKTSSKLVNPIFPSILTNFLALKTTTKLVLVVQHTTLKYQDNEAYLDLLVKVLGALTSLRNHLLFFKDILTMKSDEDLGKIKAQNEHMSLKYPGVTKADLASPLFQSGVAFLEKVLLAETHDAISDCFPRIHEAVNQNNELEGGDPFDVQIIV